MCPTGDFFGDIVYARFKLRVPKNTFDLSVLLETERVRTNDTDRTFVRRRKITKGARRLSFKRERVSELSLFDKPLLKTYPGISSVETWLSTYNNNKTSILCL